MAAGALQSRNGRAVLARSHRSWGGDYNNNIYIFIKRFIKYIAGDTFPRTPLTLTMHI